MPKRLGRLLAIALLLLSSGCATIKHVFVFKEQPVSARAIARVQGQIDVEGGANGTLVVVLAQPGRGEAGKPRGIDSFVRVRGGSYAFPVKPCRYIVGAYEDRNQNGLLDPGELVKRLRAGREFEVAPGEVETEDILPTKADVLPELKKSINVFGIIARTPKEPQQFSLWAWSVQGEICKNLDDDVFGPKTSQTRAEARDRARSRWPYDYDHTEILHAPEVASRLNTILKERFQGGWSIGRR